MAIGLFMPMLTGGAKRPDVFKVLSSGDGAGGASVAVPAQIHTRANRFLIVQAAGRLGGIWNGGASVSVNGSPIPNLLDISSIGDHAATYSYVAIPKAASSQSLSFINWSSNSSWTAWALDTDAALLDYSVFAASGAASSYSVPNDPGDFVMWTASGAGSLNITGLPKVKQGGSNTSARVMGAGIASSGPTTLSSTSNFFGRSYLIAKGAIYDA